MPSTTMKLFSVLLVVLFLGACSSTEDDVAVSSAAGYGEMGQGIDGSDVYGENLGAPVPGSPADFVANVGDRVYFGYDSYAVTGEAESTLNSQAQWLQQYPNASVTVEGHCDERGTREYNLALGERRAMAVKNYLVSLGVSPSRVTTISYGKERPAVAGSNASAWAQNRRGVTVIN